MAELEPTGVKDSLELYIDYIKKMRRWSVQWRDMALKDLFKLVRSHSVTFKALVVSSRVVFLWNETTEDIEEKNLQMFKTDVVIIACDELSDGEAYSFGTVEEGTKFAVLVKNLVSKGVPASKAISVAYRHAEKKSPKKPSKKK